MRRAATWLALAVTTLALLLQPVAAQEPGEGVTLERTTALVGDQIRMTVRVLAPAGATVELTPGTDSWNGIELVRAERPVPAEQGEKTLWTIEAVIAGFVPGQTEFAPAVAVVTNTDVQAKVLQPVRLTVASVLGPDDPLVLRPLAPPVAIPGDESPWLRPMIAVGIGIIALLVLGLMWLLWRLLQRALRGGGEPLFAPAVAEEPGLDSAERVLDSDPVAAYRLMSSVVKSELAKRYGLRATALTTAELRTRLENAGADRWEARLVGGLLEECDAVIYAGYRPAAERRAADLTMAREIVEVA